VIELVVIPALIVLAGFVVYRVFVRTIRNPRPLGGANVLVTAGADGGSELSFALGRGGVLFGTTESLVTWSSRDGGATWHSVPGPAVPGGSCASGWPRAVAGPGGREYLAFLAGTYCGDTLTPYLAISSRSGPAGRWSRLVRVAPATWKYGFDDAPSLAVAPRTGRLYAAWSRNLDPKRTTVVTSTSSDGGRTWTTPRPVSPRLDHPHLAQVAVAGDGTVYVAGIDARLGLWVARSTDEGRSFSTPRRAAPLLANPASSCGASGFTPLPNELRTCTGPNPTLLLDRGRVLLVYDDIGPNRTQDVDVAALDARLRPLFRARVSPPDTGRTEQFLPAAAVDADTGVVWACWYDTTFDPHAHRVWFTCSASRDGRTWTPPERAAAKPSYTIDVLSFAAKPGLYPSIAAGAGVAHVFWADTHIVSNGVDAYTAALPERAAFARR
jgi:hypothetical protein